MLSSADYLCTPEENVYKIDFTRFKIRDMESGTVLFEITKPAASGGLCTHRIAFVNEPLLTPASFGLFSSLLLNMSPQTGETFTCRRAGFPTCSRNTVQVFLCTNTAGRINCSCIMTSICDEKGQMDVVNRSKGGGGQRVLAAHEPVSSCMTVQMMPLYLITLIS